MNKNKQKEYTAKGYHLNYVKNLSRERKTLLAYIEEKIYEQTSVEFYLDKEQSKLFEARPLQNYLNWRFPFLLISVDWNYAVLHISVETESDIEKKIRRLTDANNNYREKIKKLEDDFVKKNEKIRALELSNIQVKEIRQLNEKIERLNGEK